MSLFGKKKNTQVKYGQSPAAVPVVMQLEIMECGAACLDMILAYYGKWISLEEAREACGVSRDGQNALNIVKAARNYKMEAKGFRMGIEAFKSFDEFPCIIHWEFNHFIVLKGIKNGKVYVNDPGVGDKVMTMDDLDKGFTGIAITLKPSEEFEKGGQKPSVSKYVKKRLAGVAAMIVFSVITAVITNISGIINPIFSKVFMDRLLTGRNPEWLYPFIALLAAMTLITIAAAFINAICSLRISGKLDVVGSSSFMWKALHLPMRFYSQRMVGDIQVRQNSAASISSTMINVFAPLVINTGMMIFYLVVMLRQSVVLSAVGIASIAINYFASMYISKKRVNISRAGARDAGKLYSTTISGVEMIETIKSSGSEAGFFEKWAGYQALVNASAVKEIELTQYIGMIPTLLSAVANALVLLIGISLVISGDFSCGSVMAFQGLLASFIAPASVLIESNQMLIEMKTDMERLEDVMEYPNDEIADDSRQGRAEVEGKLKGLVEMKNVTFGYSPLDKPLLENFNMTLRPGERIAFVGRSGCGKSTLAKLISGLYEPWSGEILFDGVPIKDIDKNVFRSSLAVVDQDIILFNDTIRDNIRMWDKSIKDYEVILAARDAQIYDDILERPGGFDYVIDENGRDMSGGQKQRIEIARTLALDPIIVIMDEATSALDAITEANVVKSINDRGIGCIVVAHRLSTIRDCDEIIVLDKGHVVDRGKHEELMNRCDLYREIVASAN